RQRDRRHQRAQEPQRGGALYPGGRSGAHGPQRHGQDQNGNIECLTFWREVSNQRRKARDMPHIRSHAFGPRPCISLCFSLCITAALLVFDASAASAGKIKMVFPGPVTTFSLPYLVAQKKGWLGDLEVEDVHVTGDASAMRVLLSGNADIGLIGTLNVLAS